MRVPDSKSMPKLMPSEEIAIAPATRIVPDIEKNHFEFPMKSKCQRMRSLPAASMCFERMRRVGAREARVADGGGTAGESGKRGPRDGRERENLETAPG